MAKTKKKKSTDNPTSERSKKVTDSLPKTSFSPTLMAIRKKYGGSSLPAADSKMKKSNKLKVEVVESKKKNADVTGVQKRTKVWYGNKLLGSQG